MKAAKIILILALIGTLACGCQKSTEIPTNIEQNQASIAVSEKLVGNDTLFQQADAGGMEIWFNKWYINDGNPSFVQDYLIGGKAIKDGLSIDGLTDNGYDTRSFAFVKYKILKDKYSEISGVFGFDDNTPIKPDSKLIIYAGDQKVYESAILNSSLSSTTVKAELPAGTSDFTIRFETSAEVGKLPKLIFGDIEVKKSK